MNDERHVPNGRPQWADLRDAEQTLRAEWADDLKRFEKQLDDAILREHDTCANVHASILKDIGVMKSAMDGFDRRIREGEDFHQRLRGMTTVIVFLIGSNLALVLLTALGLLVALR